MTVSVRGDSPNIYIHEIIHPMEAWNYTLWLPEYSIQYMDICDNSVREMTLFAFLLGTDLRIHG